MLNIHSIYEKLFYISLIIWLFPPIRQFRTKFFLIFLVLAVADPISLALVIFFKINIGPIYALIASTIIAFLVLFKLSNAGSKRFYIIIYLVCFVLPLLSVNFKYYYASFTILHIIIFYQVLIIFIKENVELKAINIFLSVFLLYELTNIFKVGNLTFGITNAIEYHIITTIFQVTIGLYFSIFREDSPRNFIKL